MGYYRAAKACPLSVSAIGARSVATAAADARCSHSWQEAVAAMRPNPIDYGRSAAASWASAGRPPTALKPPLLIFCLPSQNHQEILISHAGFQHSPRFL